MEKEVKNIYQKLSEVQNELKVPKGQKNSFGNYRYRSCEDILEAVKPLLKKHEITLILSDTIKNIGERYYIEATARIHDLINYENCITMTAYAREEETKKGMDGSQITGTASSYARKYALNGLFNIDDTKDADTDEYTKTTTNQTISKQQILEIKKLMEKCNITKEELQEELGEEDLNKLSYEKADLTITMLTARSKGVE